MIPDPNDIAVTIYGIDIDLHYVYGTEFSYINNSWNISYSIVDTKSREIISRNIITDGTDKEIEKPYGIMVHPETKDIFITDAGNYVTPGVLYCFDKEGRKKWNVVTGNIPGHFALLPIYN